MHKITHLTAAIGLAIAPVLLAAPARAVLLQHTWVASTDLGGSDANSCDRTAPCRTFGTALAATAAGGEITCVNSSNFLTAFLLIDKSITINCEGAIASNTFLGGQSFGSIQINTVFTDIVTLRGLDIDALGTGNGFGINFFGAGALHLHKLKISGFSTGVGFTPTHFSRLFVSDCTIADNGAAGGDGNGILIRPASGILAEVSITRTQLENNFEGIVFDGLSGGSIRGAVRDSVIASSPNIGIAAGSAPSSSVILLIDNTTVMNSTYGLVANGTGAGLVVARSSIMFNATGLFAFGGGGLASYRNNNVGGNGVDGAFTVFAGLQ